MKKFYYIARLTKRFPSHLTARAQESLFFCKSYHSLFLFSVVLYFFPFYLSSYFWWLIFFFPIPLLYITRTHTISFADGYLWSIMVFLLHASGGTYAIACMAREQKIVGYLIGIGVAFYAALFPAFCFFVSAYIMRRYTVYHPLMRLCITAGVLFLFIIWADSYCFWIFGNQEGYPLMHPLLPLVQNPSMLLLLPIVGKYIATILLLLVSVSTVVLIWYKNSAAILFFCCIIGIWIVPSLMVCNKKKPTWRERVASLPLVVNCSGDNPSVMIKIIGNHCRKIIAERPEVDLIVMPESACNLSNASQMDLWSEQYLGKAIHIVFGACRQQGDFFNNTLYWIYNGVVQQCIDKKHAMLLSERIPWWMNFKFIRSVYGNNSMMMTCSLDDRSMIDLGKGFVFVPYICSELFFNHVPIDIQGTCAIIAAVNDTWFADSYIAQLLVMLARFKAILWQRDIVYVSYTQSLYINKQGVAYSLNDPVNTIVP